MVCIWKYRRGKNKSEGDRVGSECRRKEYRKKWTLKVTIKDPFWKLDHQKIAIICFCRINPLKFNMKCQGK